MVNKVELVEYIGSDDLHLYTYYIGESCDEGINVPLSILKRLVENQELDVFDSSRFIFKLSTDFLTYSTLKNDGIGLIYDKKCPSPNNKPESKYHIPPGWQSLKLQNDVGKFAKKGEYFDQILEKWIKIGNELKEELGNMVTPLISLQRKNLSKEYFTTYAERIDYILIISFKEFVELFNKYIQKGYLHELQSVCYDIYDIIYGIEGKPFQKTFTAFKLHKK